LASVPFNAITPTATQKKTNTSVLNSKEQVRPSPSDTPHSSNKVHHCQSPVSAVCRIIETIKVNTAVLSRGRKFSRTLLKAEVETGFTNDLKLTNYEGWNFNSGNYLFTTDTK